MVGFHLYDAIDSNRVVLGRVRVQQPHVLAQLSSALPQPSHALGHVLPQGDAG